MKTVSASVPFVMYVAKGDMIDITLTMTLVIDGKDVQSETNKYCFKPGVIGHTERLEFVIPVMDE